MPWIQKPITWVPRATELAAIVLVIWAAVGWLTPLHVDRSGITGPVTDTRPLPDVRKLVDTPLFGQQETGKEKPAAAEPAAPSHLDIKLLGTVVAGPQSAAVVTTNHDKEQKVFLLGDTLQAGVTLKAVEPDSITVDNHGKLERIDILKDASSASRGGNSAPPLPQPGTPPGLAPAPYPAGRPIPAGPAPGLMNQAPDNLSQLMSQARVVPHFADGKVDGFAISEIVSGSLYQEAGLQNGDIIRKVNDQVVSGPLQVMQLSRQLQNAKSIELEIMRGNAIQRLSYTAR